MVLMCICSALLDCAGCEGEMQAGLPSAYAAELVLWPAFQAFNFWKVPVRHQLLAVNTACLLDATFLCCSGLPSCLLRRPQPR